MVMVQQETNSKTIREKFIKGLLYKHKISVRMLVSTCETIFFNGEKRDIHVYVVKIQGL